MIDVLIDRPKPCICVSCPACGNVFMGAVFSAAKLAEDDVLRRNLESYAKQGYTIDVRNAGTFELYKCKCKNCF